MISLGAMPGCRSFMSRSLPEGWLGKPNALQTAY